MKNQVLLISHTGDEFCINRIKNAIHKHGGEAICFYADKYPGEHLITVNYENDKKEIWFNDGNKIHDLTQLTAVWYRRLDNFGKQIMEHLSPEFRRPSWEESKVTFKGLLSGLATDTFTLNTYQGVKHADAKEEQLRIAKTLGFKIPKTCITNDPEKAKTFIDNCKAGAISKMQSTFSLNDKEGEEVVVFTNDVSSADIERLEGIRYCPMKFQEKIEKKLELRTTIIGNQCFTVAIDSQKNEGGKTDWRKLAHETIQNWYPYQLPKSIEEKLIAYNRYFHLNYSAADIILTPDDQYVFLESNPAGEFLWADTILNEAISDQIGKVLVLPSERMPHTPYHLAKQTVFE